MEIKVLGAGCTKCKTLEKKVHEVLDEMQLEANVEKIEDITKILEYGIMTTPGLVIDNQVVFSGRIPSNKEITDIITSKK
ncbi:MAG: thioredoxin family protein [Bacteroidales bacterium]|nr:thioredoxin family protein [Bacteroidales bacterium]